MTAPRRSDAVYELTVSGRLGPVLRAMAEPATAASSELLTILCMVGRDGEDLVDVLERLRSRGLEVTTISAIT